MSESVRVSSCFETGASGMQKRYCELLIYLLDVSRDARHALYIRNR